MSPPTGRVALVTGGTRGIGRAIARRLAARRVRGLHLGPYRGVAARGPGAGSQRRSSRSPCAASRPTRAARRTRSVWSSPTAREGGRLDVLVNNAGLGHFGPVDSLAPEQFREVLETNLFGVYYAVHFAAPLMKKNGGGFIVNIASLAVGQRVRGRVGLQRVQVRTARLLGGGHAGPAPLRNPDGVGPARLGRHGVRAPQREPRKLLDAPARGRGRGRRGSRALSGARHSVPHRPEAVEASEESDPTRDPVPHGARGHRVRDPSRRSG